MTNCHDEGDCPWISIIVQNGNKQTNLYVRLFALIVRCSFVLRILFIFVYTVMADESKKRYFTVILAIFLARVLAHCFSNEAYELSLKGPTVLKIKKKKCQPAATSF